jgi:hypothetical protein
MVLHRSESRKYETWIDNILDTIIEIQQNYTAKDNIHFLLTATCPMPLMVLFGIRFINGQLTIIQVNKIDKSLHKWGGGRTTTISDTSITNNPIFNGHYYPELSNDNGKVILFFSLNHSRIFTDEHKSKSKEFSQRMNQQLLQLQNY